MYIWMLLGFSWVELSWEAIIGSKVASITPKITKKTKEVMNTKKLQITNRWQAKGQKIHLTSRTKLMSSHSLPIKAWGQEIGIKMLILTSKCGRMVIMMPSGCLPCWTWWTRFTARCTRESKKGGAAGECGGRRVKEEQDMQNVSRNENENGGD